MPRKRKIEASVFEKAPEAQEPATGPTSAPECAPKAKAEEPANPAAKGATPAPEVDDDPFRDIPLAECDQPKPAPEAPEAPAPAPRKKATRKRKTKPAADTGADKADSATKGTDPGLTMADLADCFLKHLEEVGKSRGTVFSYSIDAALAVRHFGENTEVASLTAKKLQAYYDSDAVTKTKTGRGKAQPTIAKTRRVLRLSLVWAAEAGLIPEAPVPTANS